MQQGDDFRHCLVKQGWAGAALHVALSLLFSGPSRWCS
jgi:hypothetical protein